MHDLTDAQAANVARIGWAAARVQLAAMDDADAEHDAGALAALSARVDELARVAWSIDGGPEVGRA